MEAINNQEKEPVILSRVFVTPEGDVIVTDLWEAVREILEQAGFESCN